MGLLKIQPFKLLGEAVEKSIPQGGAIVSTIKTGIQIVKDSKLQLKDIIKDSGQAAIDAAAARVKEGLQTSQDNVIGEKIQKAAVPLLLIGVLVFLLIRRGK